jgi:hypothetical protein
LPRVERGATELNCSGASSSHTILLTGHHRISQ